MINGKSFASATSATAVPAGMCAPVVVNGKAVGGVGGRASLMEVVEEEEEDEHPEDWREQKFWWRGTLSAKGTWSGAWVGSFKGKPSEAQFAASPTTFEVSGPAGGQSGSYIKGHYLMDNGGGLTKFKDKACFMQFEADNKVQGKGDTAFGAFYVQGTFDRATSQLCVERTYCDEDDATFMTMPGPMKKARKKK